MDIINKMKIMISELNHHTMLYEKGIPEWTDKEWDDKFFELVKMEEEAGFCLDNSPTQKISWDTVSALEKVKHNHPMLSLAKTKDKEEFINYFSKIDPGKDIIGMLKLDGLTCSLRYLDGHLVSAETRGDGEIGENILHNAKINCSIPLHISYREELIIDGEIICPFNNFAVYDEKNGGNYKNPRNFAAGKIRSLKAEDSCPQDLVFVVWNVIKGFEETNSFKDKLDYIEKLGFSIVPYVTSLDWDWDEFLKEKAKQLCYPIDGLVGRFNDIKFGESLGVTEHHVKAAYAFKFYDEEYDTTLLDIEWSMGRTGQITPVAIFESIDIDGTEISRASLHNLNIIEETLGTPYKGQKIKVAKMNMIIPQITWGEPLSIMKNNKENKIIDEPCFCPVCGKETSIVTSNSGVKSVFCTNSQCEGKLINKLDYFCGKKGLDIKGLSKMTLEKLIDWGWVNSIKDIFNLSNFREEWIGYPGFGAKSVDNILNAIEMSKNVKFANAITAFGIPLIGSAIAKDLSSKFKNYADFRKAIEEDFDFTQFNGYGYEMNKSLLNFDYTEMDDIVLSYLNLKYENEEVKASKITDKIFAITGKSKFGNRQKVKELIQSYGGHVVDNVNGKTDYLLCNKPENSSKYNNALKYNTTIIGDEELEEIING